MSSCAFFGHRCFNYAPYREQLKSIIVDLIENHGVTQFYNGCRGSFDNICIDIISELKKRYPHIKLIMVLSYHPDKEFYISERFDGSVYLLEKSVPPKFAISHTNRRLVELVDYIVAGVFLSCGGAYNAYKRAKTLNKKILEIKYEKEKIL